MKLVRRFDFFNPAAYWLYERGKELTIINRDLPILLDWPTPDGEVEDLNKDVSKDAICSHNLDQPMLFQAHPGWSEIVSTSIDLQEKALRQSLV